MAVNAPNGSIEEKEDAAPINFFLNDIFDKDKNTFYHKGHKVKPAQRAQSKLNGGIGLF